MKTLQAGELTAFFETLAPLRSPLDEDRWSQPFTAPRLRDAFEALRAPLEEAKAKGGLLNLWALAGLKRDENRISGVLAGLWMDDFGGTASRNFLTGFLSLAVPGVDWEDEAAAGYIIRQEINPLGDTADRIDLAVETARHLVGIEVKVDAGLGPQQLERYAAALDVRARHAGRQAHLVLLAPFPAAMDAVRSATWPDVAAAAHAAAGYPERNRNFTEQYIALFGDYVENL